MYGPTTEEDPGPARGARSGLAAYFSLGRLKRHRRALKISQLVSPRSARASSGRGGRSGPGAAVLCAREAAEPLLLSLVVREAAVSVPPLPSLSARGGGRYPPGPAPAGRPLILRTSHSGSPVATEHVRRVQEIRWRSPKSSDSFHSSPVATLVSSPSRISALPPG